MKMINEWLSFSMKFCIHVVFLLLTTVFLTLNPQLFQDNGFLIVVFSSMYAYNIWNIVTDYKLSKRVSYFTNCEVTRIIAKLIDVWGFTRATNFLNRKDEEDETDDKKQ